jgi:hypothetical protein
MQQAVTIACRQCTSISFHKLTNSQDSLSIIDIDYGRLVAKLEHCVIYKCQLAIGRKVD